MNLIVNYAGRGNPLGNCLLFLVLASDLDRGDLDLQNDLEDLDRSFHRFFEEDLKVLLDREHE